MTSPLDRMIWATGVPIKATGPKGCAQRCLLLLLARRVGLDLRCIIGQHQLRTDSRLSDEPCANALRDLEDEGLISRKARYGPQEKTGKIIRLSDEITLLIADNPVPAKAEREASEDPQSVPRNIGGTGPSVTRDLLASTPDFRPVPSEIRGAEGGIEGGIEGGERAREMFEGLFARMPERSRKGSSAKLMHAAWTRLEQPVSIDALSSAVDRWAADPASKQLAHYWISDETFREWLTAEAKPLSRADELRRIETLARAFLRDNTWHPVFGPKPGESGCKLPDEWVRFIQTVAGVPSRAQAEWAADQCEGAGLASHECSPRDLAQRFLTTCWATRPAPPAEPERIWRETVDQHIAETTSGPCWKPKERAA